MKINERSQNPVSSIAHRFPINCYQLILIGGDFEQLTDSLIAGSTLFILTVSGMKLLTDIPLFWVHLLCKFCQCVVLKEMIEGYTSLPCPGIWCTHQHGCVWLYCSFSFGFGFFITFLKEFRDTRTQWVWTVVFHVWLYKLEACRMTRALIIIIILLCNYHIFNMVRSVIICLVGVVSRPRSVGLSPQGDIKEWKRNILDIFRSAHQNTFRAIDIL